jgi:hypothetical protein
MRPITLRALTWATVAAAVASALWLASVDTDTDVASALRVTVATPATLANAA